MKWVIIILIVLAVLLAAALICTAMKRKKNEVARQRAGELRSEAATSAVAKQEQEARAREAEAEAERARAQADKLDARAQSERTSYDQTRAVQEDRLREADRLDPDVDHRDPNYTPGAGATPGEHTPGEHTRRATPASTRPAAPSVSTRPAARPVSTPTRSAHRAARSARADAAPAALRRRGQPGSSRPGDLGPRRRGIRGAGGAGPVDLGARASASRPDLSRSGAACAFRD